MEIHHLVHGLEFYAGLASKVRGSHVPLPQKGAYGMVVRQPIGVCGGIVPWNFPLTLMGTKLGPALAAGNTIIVKPASTTPLATIKVIELIAQATFGEGKAQKPLPKGTVNIVTGPGGSVGEELLRNPRIRRIAFTGSTPVGRHVMEVAGREIKRVTLELGGSDPMIVMEDANLDLAVKMADVGRYFNCGQMCLGVKRLFLQESIADNFVGGLVEILKKKTVGNGMSKETRMGPIHIGSQRQEVEEQVEDAKARGAKLLFGGERPKGGDFDKGFFYLPTLMTQRARRRAHDQGRSLRSRAAGLYFQDAGRSAGESQLFGIRPRLVDLDAQFVARQQSDRQAPGRQRVGQLASLRLRRAALRRRQIERRRPRARPRSSGLLSRAQGRRVVNV